MVPHFLLTTQGFYIRQWKEYRTHIEKRPLPIVRFLRHLFQSQSGDFNECVWMIKKSPWILSHGAASLTSRKKNRQKWTICATLLQVLSVAPPVALPSVLWTSQHFQLLSTVTPYSSEPCLRCRPCFSPHIPSLHSEKEKNTDSPSPWSNKGSKRVN